jgi:hypothetical protein
MGQQRRGYRLRGVPGVRLPRDARRGCGLRDVWLGDWGAGDLRSGPEAPGVSGGMN